MEQKSEVCCQRLGYGSMRNDTTLACSRIRLLSRTPLLFSCFHPPFAIPSLAGWCYSAPGIHLYKRRNEERKKEQKKGREREGRKKGRREGGGRKGGKTDGRGKLPGKFIWSTEVNNKSLLMHLPFGHRYVISTGKRWGRESLIKLKVNFIFMKWRPGGNPPEPFRTTYIAG